MEPGTFRNLALGAVGVFVAGYCMGRGHISDTSHQEDTQKHESEHQEVIEIRKPDGTVKKITRIDKNKDSQTKIETKVSTSKTNVSLLASVDYSESVIKPIYGISVSRELIGPITLGVFGMSNMTLGVSIGINF